MRVTEQKFAGLVNAFVAATGDADERHASVNQYLCRVFNDISPADLTTAEAAALVDALEPAFIRVTETSVNRGAPGIPRGTQLREILKRVSPGDLSATEAILVLTILLPVHSRFITAQADGSSGQPVQRLLLGPVETS